jgi:hypothetical protein
MSSKYLLFGGHAAANNLDVGQTLSYLRDHGFGNGELHQARVAMQEHEHVPFVFEPLNASYCDFCFVKLMGGEFDRLKDGRERCIRCSRTVVRTSDEFRETFEGVRRNMEAACNISLSVTMRVRMVNARQIARHTGERFDATPGVDARVLCFAKQSKDGYSLFIENGSPKLAAITTIAHELTHIWQYRNWNVTQIERLYGPQNRLIVYEGMATWVQVQYLLLIGETQHAARQEAYAAQRDDEYGVGFRMFVERYPLSRHAGDRVDTPFQHRHPL